MMMTTKLYNGLASQAAVNFIVFDVSHNCNLFLN